MIQIIFEFTVVKHIWKYEYGICYLKTDLMIFVIIFFCVWPLSMNNYILDAFYAWLCFLWCCWKFFISIAKNIFNFFTFNKIGQLELSWYFSNNIFLITFLYNYHIIICNQSPFGRQVWGYCFQSDWLEFLYWYVVIHRTVSQ